PNHMTREKIAQDIRSANEYLAKAFQHDLQNIQRRYKSYGERLLIYMNGGKVHYKKAEKAK
ncbi:hypothetical protein, partial [Bacillus cereus]|uniref:hypothetical protein n=1 Tax=Bacillus cereus TaxID=1396 RepID=UPI0034D48BE1